LALALAALNAGGEPPRAALIAVVLALGSTFAIAGPSISSYLPTLVPRSDLPGAVSLFSVQMNLARVVGPAIGGVMLQYVGFSGIFLMNAAMPLFAMVAISTGPPPAPPVLEGTALDRMLGGFRIARRDPLVRGVVLSIATFSLVCLPFVGLIPVVAAENLGVDVKAGAYGLLYACFGFGAALGAAGVGSVLVGVDRQRVVRASLLLFAGLLALWAVIRTPALGYPTLIALGASYFTITTSWATTLQEHLDDAVRGRVMALYMMGFGGTVPIGLLLFGSLSEAIGLTPILLIGAVAAVVMAAVVHLRREPVAGGLEAHSPEPDAAFPA
jgi:predicted MFS family arabinose efflux permease